jgi:hypothetical protein
MVDHPFGGPWTEIKLDAVQYYLECYAKALTPKKFDLWYIDAFAATGDRVETRKVGGLLEGIPESTVTETLAGSARRALKVNNATMLLWIKIGGVIFFLGVLAFALAFALPQLSIFSLDEMLHAIRKKEKDVAAKQRVTSASAILAGLWHVGRQRLLVLRPPRCRAWRALPAPPSVKLLEGQCLSRPNVTDSSRCGPHRCRVRLRAPAGGLSVSVRSRHHIRI